MPQFSGHSHLCPRRMSTARLANQIAKALRQAAGEDVLVSVSESALSEARYINITTDDEDLKIRVAAHETKPTYERQNPSDFHVGDTVTKDGQIIVHEQDSDGDWLAAVAWACRQLAIPVSVRVAKMISKQSGAIVARRAAMEAAAIARVEASKQAEQNYQQRLARLPAEHREVLEHYETLHGKQRKNFRGSRKYKRVVATMGALKQAAS